MELPGTRPSSTLARSKQTQAVLGGLAVTGHIDVDELGGDGKIAKLDGVGAVVIDQDVLLAEPLVGDGLLLVVGQSADGTGRSGS